MQFEYRRPEVEQALRSAKTIEALEAALRQVAGLMSDLGKPDVYGHKLFAPGLDAAVPVIASGLTLPDVPLAKSNENVCIVATQLYRYGGHSKVAYDISELIGADRTTVVLTDVYGKLTHAALLGARNQTSPLKRRADLLLGANTLSGKILELYNLLAAVRPTRIFLNTHHFDIVAAVALWPFRQVVEFLHHADHVPAIGATLPWSTHVDLTWRCHLACRQAGLEPVYAGMTVRGGRDIPNASSASDGSPLRIATCGPAAKFKGAASHRWVDYAVAALAGTDSEILHIGPTDEDFRSEIAQALNAAGVAPDRYAFVGPIDDLAAELVARGADIYLSSYPMSGGKTNLEAMAAGLPVIVPVDAASPQLLQFAFPTETWTRVEAPEELASVLSNARTLVDTARRLETRTLIAEELNRFRHYVLRESLRPLVAGSE